MLDHIQSYVRPASVEEALAALSGERTAIIAGGTDLVADGARGVDTLVDITALGLGDIQEAGGEIRLGACVTLHQVAESARIASYLNGIIGEAARASTGSLLRCAATVGGNVVTATPRWDVVTALLAADATVTLTSGETSLADLLSDGFPKGAILTGLRLPATPAGTGSSFHKIAINALDVGIATAAVRLTLDAGRLYGVRVALGCVAEKPVRVRHAEDVLEGYEPTPSRIQEAAENATQGLTIREDVRAAADYRDAMARVAVRRALEEAIGRATR